MLRALHKKAFASIVEVIVTSIIFVIAAMGILTTISMLRPQGLESSQKLTAAYYAKNIMDSLRVNVQANTWISNTGPLATGTMHSNTIGAYTINWYLIEVDPAEYPAGMAPRKLFMNAYYPD